MTGDVDALALDPVPRSVQRARRWVASACRAHGRDDLVESAESGVSELVTNALLHAPGPIEVRVRGTAAHPRVEVLDTSPEPPRPLPGPPEPPEVGGPESVDDLLSTVGRGLRILATDSLAWGAETRPDGKVVWFVPVAQPRTELSDAELAGTLTSSGPASPPGDDGETREVHLLAVPPGSLAQFRRHHRELRRELRLLALAHGRDYPRAEQLSEVFAELEDTVGRPVDAAAAAPHAPYDDLVLRVPVAAGASAERMTRLLDLADEFCTAARLLTLARTPEQREFGRWLLDEVARQCAGAEARPWSRTDDVGRYSSP